MARTFDCEGSRKRRKKQRQRIVQANQPTNVQIHAGKKEKKGKYQQLFYYPSLQAMASKLKEGVHTHTQVREPKEKGNKLNKYKRKEKEKEATSFTHFFPFHIF